MNKDLITDDLISMERLSELKGDPRPIRMTNKEMWILMNTYERDALDEAYDAYNNDLARE